MPSIPANELKTRGVTAIEQALAENTEAIVSVRGKDKYVVMSFEQYSHLRTCELEAAIHETRARHGDLAYVSCIRGTSKVTRGTTWRNLRAGSRATLTLSSAWRRR